MIGKIKKIIRKWGQSILELLVFFPVLLALGIFVMPANLVWAWLGSIPAYYLAGLLMGRLLQRKRRIVDILVGMVISGAGACFLFGMGVYAILPWLFGTAAFERGIQLMGSKWEDIFPTAVLWVGMVVYFIGYFFYSRLEVLKPFVAIVGWAGIAYMVLVLFVVNFVQLKSASLPGDNEPVLPKVLKKHNRVLITIIILVTAAISFFNSLKEGVEWVINGIGYLVWRFAEFLANLLAPSSQQGPSGMEGGGLQDLFPPAEEKPPSIFDQIVQVIGVILAIIAVIAFLALLGFALYRLFKKIAAWLSRFYQMGRDLEDYGGYVDEKESLMDFRELGKNYINRFSQWLAELMEKEPKWEEMKTNRERVRYIYRNFILNCMAKGYQYKGHLTPMETGEDLSQLNPENAQELKMLTETYGDARYGDKEIDDGRVERLIQAFLKK